MLKSYLLKQILVVLLVAFASPLWAQSRTVTGIVTSEDDGTSLPGVSVVEKGTNNGTVTDADGKFSINIADNATLIFSFVGFNSQEVAVAGQSVINVVLQTNVTSLDEIVVVGYGEQEKKDVTGSVVAITSKDFNRGVLTSPQDLMVGKIAGVSITSSGGAPGAGSTIRIRGGASLNANNDPLIVIDGFPVDNNGLAGSSNPLASLNPNDIESFTVLKDASATAIYGSRASNGVIIITTKRGGEGKMKLQYNGNVSVGTLAKKLDVMSGDEYRDYVTAKANAGTVSGLNNDALVRLGSENTDWQKEIYRTAVSHDHNLNAAGSFKNVPYRVSYGFTDQKGILKNTDLKRHSLNLNFSPSLLDDNLKITANLKSSFTQNNFGNQGAVGAAVRFDPTQPIRNGNTLYGGYFTWTELADNLPGGVMNPDGDVNFIGVSNPVALIEQTDNTADVTRHIGNLQVDYRLPFLPELKVNVNAGFDFSSSDGENNSPSNAAFTFRNGPGSFTKYSADNKSTLLDLYLDYLKEVGDHKIQLTGGYSYQDFERDGKSISRMGDGTVTYGDDTDDDGIADAPRPNIPSPNTLISLFGRANYSFNDRFLVTLTLRNDYSSRFFKENRSGIFPAASLGWNIINEEFIKSVSQISQLKIRASYGLTGQQDIGGNSYPYLPTYVESTSTAQYQFGNTFYNTLRPSAYDQSIKWEETSTLNVGLDFGILSDKITGAVDYYQRNTTDLIGFVPIPAGSNFSNYLTTNVGDMENKGIEITLNATPISTNDLTWNLGFNFTHNVNEITKLNQTGDEDFQVNVGGIAGGVGNTIQVHKIGYPAFAFYTFRQVYDVNGRPIEGLYVDKTGEGGNVISNVNNKFIDKNPNARFLMGINSRVNYKQFDFAFSSRISLHNYVYNNVFSSNAVNNELYNQSGFFGNVPTSIRDTDFNAQQLFSDYYLQNASFFKLDNIGAGYSTDLSDKIKARFSFTVQNALVITKYDGIDPEVSGGIDNNIYPRPRTFLVGISLTY